MNFFYNFIILRKIYMINIDPMFFFKIFLYIKDVDNSTPKLIL